ncbi:MAG: peptidyl-prolyl cis-trans isomerase [Candidatus Aminicenantes bacterium]|nr:peptidyl-prolyl cis-trans isomerase [Candidatus Aminicenantes bacterium]
MKQKIFLTVTLALVISLGLLAAETIEEIYAVVNDEVITGSELKQFETDMLRALHAQLEGEKLEEALLEMKNNLLNKLIEQKLLMSKIKEKNYNVDSDVEMIIQDIKKQYNFASDEDLKNALRQEGIEFGAWKEQWKERRKQERLVAEEVGSKIKVDNPQIMEYYRSHPEQYTIPAEMTLNCIFLEKSAGNLKLQETMDLISAELKPGLFESVAKKYSQLPDAENNVALGKFKKGELDKNLEDAALKLKKDEYSGWIETDKGWYIIQLADFSPDRLQEVKDVREDILYKLREEQQQIKLKEYIEQLKKDSYIKILKKFP